MRYTLVPLLASATLVLASTPEPVELKANNKKDGGLTSCNANSANVKALNAATRAPVLFCMWWRGNGGNGKLSPFSKLSKDQVASTCKCILSKPDLGKTTLATISASSKVENLVDLQNDFGQPLQLCQYWMKSSSKDASPFIDISPSELTPLCKTIIANPKLVVTATTMSTTTKTGSKTSTSAKANASTAKRTSAKTTTTNKKAASSSTGKTQSNKSTQVFSMPTFVPSANGSTPATTASRKSAKTSKTSVVKVTTKAIVASTTTSSKGAKTTTIQDSYGGSYGDGSGDSGSGKGGSSGNHGDDNTDDGSDGNGSDLVTTTTEEGSKTTTAEGSTATGDSYGGSYGGDSGGY